MDAFRIISCPIEATPEQAARIEATLRSFARACNYVAMRSKQDKVSAKARLQKLCYYDVRGRFGLSANLAIAAIQRVSAMVKASKTRDVSFRPTSADYDARTFSFRESDWTVSLTLVGGRERFPLKIGEWQKDELRGTEPKSAVLCKKSNGRYYVDIRLRREQPPVQESTGTLGVDMGVKNIAVTSTGIIYSSEALNAYGLERHRVRKSLQSKAAKGTRSSSRRNCRKALARLSGKERRRCKEENHVISRRIVREAKARGLTIVLEDLSGASGTGRISVCAGASGASTIGGLSTSFGSSLRRVHAASTRRQMPVCRWWSSTPGTQARRAPAATTSGSGAATPSIVQTAAITITATRTLRRLSLQSEPP